LWLHMGANFGSRPYRETVGGLVQEPGLNLRNSATATADLLETARAAFAGLGGLAQPRLADPKRAAGEMIHVLAAGYPTALGLLGGLPMFHTLADDATTTTPSHLEPVGRALAQVILAARAASER